jgi:hypothetical protein
MEKIMIMVPANYDETDHYVPQLAEVVYERNNQFERNQHISI